MFFYLNLKFRCLDNSDVWLKLNRNFVIRNIFAVFKAFIV